MQENSNKVTVKLKKGSWEIEVTCDQDKVQQVIESVLAGMSSKELTQSTSFEEVKKTETCRTLLLKMWKEGFFSQPRALSEVDDEIRKRGYNYDRTAIAHTLVDLVREGKFTREGTPRNYTYVQKFPFKQEVSE